MTTIERVACNMKGTYVMGGRLFVPWSPSNCALTASRPPRVPPVIAAVLTPGKASSTSAMRTVMPFVLCRNCKSEGANLVRKVFPYSEWSMAKKRG